MSFTRPGALPAVAAAALCAVIGLAVAAPAAAAGSLAAQYGTASHHRMAQATAVKTGLAAGVPFCKKLAKGQIEASLAMNLYCFGPRRGHAPGRPAVSLPVAPAAVPRNVDAASPAEDVSPAGVPAEGQEETSIAAAGPYVVEAWNDAPVRCLTLTDVSPCSGPSATVRVPIVSMQGTLVPGYDRGGGNDFPRLAVSDRYHTVSMVWNDARYHRYGDILLQSFDLGSLRPVQARPVVLDRPHQGGLSFLPGLRVADGAGRLAVSWYSRPSVDTARTSVEAAIGVSPQATATPPNVRITNVASDWALDSSDGAPNFGDYTDNTVGATARWPYTGNTVYFAWSDGRLGFPQPFMARIHL